jgi:hypothetical protein
VYGDSAQLFFGLNACLTCMLMICSSFHQFLFLFGQDSEWHAH